MPTRPCSRISSRTSSSLGPVASPPIAARASPAVVTGSGGTHQVRASSGRRSPWQVLHAIGSWRQLTTPASPVQSVAGKTGAVTLARGDVGLGNVDNTSDAAKPISTATQTALDGKANAGAIAPPAAEPCPTASAIIPAADEDDPIDTAPDPAADEDDPIDTAESVDWAECPSATPSAPAVGSVIGWPSGAATTTPGVPPPAPSRRSSTSAAQPSSGPT